MGHPYRERHTQPEPTTTDKTPGLTTAKKPAAKAKTKRSSK